MAAITQSGFDGGISNNTKSGLKDACRFSRNLDIYSDGDSVSLNPIPIKDSGSVVTDLVTWMVDASPYDTNRYAYGDSGNLYKITSGGVWTVDRVVPNNSTGQGLVVFNNYLYYASRSNIGRKGLLDGTPTFNDNFFQANAYILDQFINTSTLNTYTPPVAISEAAADLFSFTPTKDPIYQIQIFLTTKGTGSITLTIHDSLNNTLGTVTVLNASLNASNYIVFTPATAIRIIIGNTYHIHLTSTVADSGIPVVTSANLSTLANYFQYTNTLVDDTQFHPMVVHTNGITGTVVIGNANYFAVWDGNTYNPNKVAIDPNYKIRGFVKDGEFLVALAWKGTNIDSFETGYAFYWDGFSPYYNFSKPITGGSINAGLNFKNRILSVCGSSGDLYMYTDPFKKIQPMPKLGEGKKIEVLPGAMTTWQTRAHVGYGVNTDDAVGLEQGVYEFGNQSDRKIDYNDVSTEVLNYGYQISTGTTQSTSMKIGCVFGVGKDMYISWKDGASYGVDKVTKGNNPAATGSWESLITDVSADNQGNLYPAPQKTKIANKLVVTFVSLPVGCTVTPKYRLERATSFTLGTAVTSSSATPTIAEFPINKRYREAEYGFNVTATVNYPVITGIYWQFDPLEGERNEN